MGVFDDFRDRLTEAIQHGIQDTRIEESLKSISTRYQSEERVFDGLQTTEKLTKEAFQSVSNYTAVELYKKVYEAARNSLFDEATLKAEAKKLLPDYEVYSVKTGPTALTRAALNFYAQIATKGMENSTDEVNEIFAGKLLEFGQLTSHLPDNPNTLDDFDKLFKLKKTLQDAIINLRNYSTATPLTNKGANDLNEAIDALRNISMQLQAQPVEPVELKKDPKKLTEYINQQLINIETTIKSEILNKPSLSPVHTWAQKLLNILLRIVTFGKVGYETKTEKEFNKILKPLTPLTKEALREEKKAKKNEQHLEIKPPHP